MTKVKRKMLRVTLPGVVLDGTRPTPMHEVEIYYSGVAYSIALAGAREQVMAITDREAMVRLRDALDEILKDSA
jgi:hypothetical protein